MGFVQKNQETPGFERLWKRYPTWPPPAATHCCCVWLSGGTEEDAGRGCRAGELLSMVRRGLVLGWSLKSSKRGSHLALHRLLVVGPLAMKCLGFSAPAWDPAHSTCCLFPTGLVKNTSPTVPSFLS